MASPAPRPLAPQPLKPGELRSALADTAKVLGIVTLRWRALARRWWATTGRK